MHKYSLLLFLFTAVLGCETPPSEVYAKLYELEVEFDAPEEFNSCLTKQLADLEKSLIDKKKLTQVQNVLKAQKIERIRIKTNTHDALSCESLKFDADIDLIPECDKTTYEPADFSELSSNSLSRDGDTLMITINMRELNMTQYLYQLYPELTSGDNPVLMTEKEMAQTRDDMKVDGQYTFDKVYESSIHYSIERVDAKYLTKELCGSSLNLAKSIEQIQKLK